MKQTAVKRRVFVSERKVTASEAENIVPQGYRLATPGEIVAAGGELARKLREEWLAVWTGQIGSKSCYCIVEKDGQIREVSPKEFDEAPPEWRIQFHGGRGRVAVCGNPLYYYAGHDLHGFSDIGKTTALPVAYIKEDWNADVVARVPLDPSQELLIAKRQ